MNVCIGFVCVAGGLVCLLLALTEGQSWGWTSYRILILLTAGVLLLALFVVVELEVDRPLLDVTVFRHWAFTNSLLLVSVLSVGLFAVLFYIPLFLQQGKGLGYYIEGAGGYGTRADKGRVSVTYANGEVRTRKKALFFRSDPQPGPGAEVFVPVRDTLARVNYVQLFTSLAQIIASAVTTFYVIKHL